MLDTGDHDSTGDPTLDRMLGGGFPPGSTTLFDGSQGTGKSTLAHQFLQAGIQAGDHCLLVNTEEAPATIQTKFQAYDWNLNSENLTIASLTPTAGTVDGEQALSLTTVNGEEPFDSFSAATASEYITRFASRLNSIDRVVIDSLSALTTYQQTTRSTRTIVNLIELFTTEFNATTLFIAEGPAPIEPLPYLVDTTITFHAPTEDESHQLTLQIQHANHTAYDPRRRHLEFTDTGVRLGPDTHALPDPLKQHAHTSTGIQGLDTLTGGGLVTGTGSILCTDGQATLGPLLTAILATLHHNEYSLTLIPPLELRPQQLHGMLAGHGLNLRDLLRADELYVVDFVGAWDAAESNVYSGPDDRSQLEGVLREVDELTDGRRATIASADILAHSFGPDDIRALRYHQEGRLLGQEDVLMYLHNPDVVPDVISAFYTDTATQHLSTWLTEDGRQQLALITGPSGSVGSTVPLEHIPEQPYVRVQRPPTSP